MLGRPGQAMWPPDVGFCAVLPSVLLHHDVHLTVHIVTPRHGDVWGRPKGKVPCVRRKRRGNDNTNMGLT